MKKEYRTMERKANQKNQRSKGWTDNDRIVVADCRDHAWSAAGN